MQKKPQKFHYYNIYGLHLCVDRALPEVQPIRPLKSESDLVRIFMVGQSNQMPAQPQTNESPYYSSPHQDTDGTPVLRVWHDQLYYHLVYLYGNQFLISRTGNAVWCSWPAKSDFGLVIAYLLGPVLGFVLQLREVLVLHASVVALDGQAIAILGASGAGKSTIAAELCRQGCQVLSDDVAALTWSSDQQVMVQPGYPRLRLWPESAEALFGPNHNLRLMIPGPIQSGSNAQLIDKRYLELDTGQSLFISKPQPLRAIYIIDWRDINAEARITPLDGAAGLAMLDAQSYISYLLDWHSRTRQLAALARLIRCVPTRQLHPVNTLATLPSLARAILKDIAMLIDQ